MAQRPVFLPQTNPDDPPSTPFVRTVFIDFTWTAGRDSEHRRQSLGALHAAAYRELEENSSDPHQQKIQLLEVSTLSNQLLGRQLSAFNLTFTTRKGRTFCVESAYQGSKVFCPDSGSSEAGPFTDLYAAPPLQARCDERLRTHGRLAGFRFFGQRWPLEPENHRHYESAFYDWLYINALKQHPDLARQVMDYQGFTDMAFTPKHKRYFSTQAYAVALYVSLNARGLLNRATSSPESFREIVRLAPMSNARRDEARQPELF